MEQDKPKRKMWYQFKIEELEAKLKELESHSQEEVLQVAIPETFLSESNTATVTEVDTKTDVTAYAQGVYDTLCKYGILSKESRRKIRDNILANGSEKFLRNKNPWSI